MEAGERVGDFLLSKELDDAGKEFGANFAKEGARIAKVFEIARTNNDVWLGLSSDIVEFFGLADKMLAVGIHQNSVIIIVISGIFEASLDSPSITHIKEVSDAVDTGLLDYCGGVVGGIIVNNYDVGTEVALFDSI